MSPLDTYNFLVELLRQNTEAFVAAVIGLAAGLFLRISKRLFDRGKAGKKIKELESALAARTKEAQTGQAIIETLKDEASKADESQDDKLKACEEKVAQYERLLEVVEKQDGAIWTQPPREGLPIPAFVSRGANRKAVIISFFNLKGGVGKTTLTSNLGILWAQNHKVLLIDLDYQQSLTKACLRENWDQVVGQERVINHVWQAGADMSRLRLSRWWEPVKGQPNAHVVAVQSGLADQETKSMIAWLAGRTSDDVRFRLRHLLHHPEIANAYDYILIDCPPRLTTACVNALAASDHVIIPVIPDDKSIDAVGRLVREVGQLKDELPSMGQLQILGVVGNRMNARRPEAELTRWNQLQQSAAAAHYHVFESQIRYFTAAAQAGHLSFQALHGDHRLEFEALRNEIDNRIL